MNRALKMGWMRYPAVAIGLVCFLGASGISLADERVPESVGEGFAALQEVGGGELERLRGREGFRDLVSVQSVQNMEAAVSDASFTAGTIVTGGIRVEAGAMERFSGIGQFNMLTGNGNAVNTGVTISIYAPVQNP
ncbi:hypothetical protein [Billgrantia gudaonensis]|uniref:Uncharacterized protein n=1 Tax=Billgrantia gudaonensis TaxID=376427 RepID=A0A1G8PFD7_9GAMM|nr:hypothetical protein [Halomonas gudaonensis]SDI91224.1 hypothetical protein SAMN04487954_10267 [Halomonas gudaonensis]